MELAARIDVDVATGTSLFLYGGPVGEPALGPSAFMMRGSAKNNPEPPITHHWFDSTHITYGVVTAGIATRHWQIEGSAFRGQEPDEDRWDIETPKLDSWSVRASWNPTPNWSAQVSHGFIKAPESTHPGENEYRTTASLHYAGGGFSAMAAFSSKDRSPGPALTAWLAEVNYDISAHHSLFGRFENVDNDELVPDHADPLHDQPFRISKLQAGYAWHTPLCRADRPDTGRERERLWQAGGAGPALWTQSVGLYALRAALAGALSGACRPSLSPLREGEKRPDVLSLQYERFKDLAMIRKLAAPLLALLVAACAGQTSLRDGARPLTVQVIGFNDFHGHLETPNQSVDAETPSGEKVRVPVGGAAYLASAIDRYRAKNPNTLVLSAGDMIGGSPITSSMFLDEPTVEVMNRIGVDFNALGNHEFDRGRQELLRMQNGGCEKFTVRQPCAVEKTFRGAQFPFLAANVITESGKTLFPATAIRKLGKGRGAVTVGIIGLPLKDIPTLASPAGLTGLDFHDEAQTINALIPQLKQQGADVIVVLIHQGLYTTVGANDKSCGGVSGDLLKILAQLDPQVDLVVSGHTHWAYLCDYGKIDPSRPFLVTSAGLWGEYITDINLTIDPASRHVTRRRPSMSWCRACPIPARSIRSRCARSSRHSSRALTSRPMSSATPMPCASRTSGRSARCRGPRPSRRRRPPNPSSATCSPTLSSPPRARTARSSRS